MEINIKEEYSRSRLNRERHIDALKSEIEGKGGLGNNTNIKLNIMDCTTDYPPTPLFIDYFLNHLTKQVGKKELIIKQNSFNRELLVLYILVLEGEYFEIKDKINDGEIEKWVRIVNKKLKENDIIIKVVDAENKVDYQYGT
jgi:hypothetical protein